MSGAHLRVRYPGYPIMFLVILEKQKALHKCRALKDTVLDCNLRCTAATEVDLKPDAFAEREQIQSTKLQIISQGGHSKPMKHTLLDLKNVCFIKNSNIINSFSCAIFFFERQVEPIK